ncbi:MAG TPA: hypothetical protein ENN73_03085 [Firmicutes bacterium]|nr:hypothetical protein [Bacillota bacterium]
MIRKILILTILLIPVLSFTEQGAGSDSIFLPRITGRLRNDLIYFSVNDDNYFYDLFEVRFLITHNFGYGRFYGDVRGYLDPGDSIFEFEDIVQPESPRLMRLFWKIYSGSGDITFGKTYLNFGNPGIFNVFEMDKQVNLTDLSYDKEGVLAVAGYIPLSTIAGIKTYISGDVMGQAGISLFSNYKSFDYGVVLNSIDPDINIAGIYFKGDVKLGVKGSWGIHFNDKFDDLFHEANLGFDYSYKKLFFSTEFIIMKTAQIKRVNIIFPKPQTPILPHGIIFTIALFSSMTNS